MNNVIDWLRTQCKEYKLEPVAIYRAGAEARWPVTAKDERELQTKLRDGGHFLPLPKEPAALANVIEVSVVDFLIRCVTNTPGAEYRRGTERGYPDLELSGAFFDNKHYAIDIKVARRAKNRRQTNSRITLYTGNTFFRYPTLKWSGTFRPFQDYGGHVDVLAIYTLNEKSSSRVDDIELIVNEPWRIASKSRSSTTREYLGAVLDIAALREGRGEFATEEEFYRFWRKFPFTIGRLVQQQLDKLLREQQKKS